MFVNSEFVRACVLTCDLGSQCTAGSSECCDEGQNLSQIGKSV